MPRRRKFKPEEIVAKLRQVDVLVSQGQNMAAAPFDNAIRLRISSWKLNPRLEPKFLNAHTTVVLVRLAMIRTMLRRLAANLES